LQPTSVKKEEELTVTRKNSVWNHLKTPTFIDMKLLKKVSQVYPEKIIV